MVANTPLLSTATEFLNSVQERTEGCVTVLEDYAETIVTLRSNKCATLHFLTASHLNFTT